MARARVDWRQADWSAGAAPGGLCQEICIERDVNVTCVTGSAVHAGVSLDAPRYARCEQEGAPNAETVGTRILGSGSGGRQPCYRDAARIGLARRQLTASLSAADAREVLQVGGAIAIGSEVLTTRIWKFFAS
jgi:hypothetical protein